MSAYTDELLAIWDAIPLRVRWSFEIVCHPSRLSEWQMVLPVPLHRTRQTLTARRRGARIQVYFHEAMSLDESWCCSECWPLVPGRPHVSRTFTPPEPLSGPEREVYELFRADGADIATALGLAKLL